jgi:hypothetical protein
MAYDSGEVFDAAGWNTERRSLRAQVAQGHLFIKGFVGSSFVDFLSCLVGFFGFTATSLSVGYNSGSA